MGEHGFLVVSITPLVIGYEVAKSFPFLIGNDCVFLETLVWANRQRLRAALVTDAALICIIVPRSINLQRYAGVLENSLSWRI